MNRAIGPRDQGCLTVIDFGDDLRLKPARGPLIDGRGADIGHVDFSSRHSLLNDGAVAKTRELDVQALLPKVAFLFSDQDRRVCHGLDPADAKRPGFLRTGGPGGSKRQKSCR